MQVRLIDYTQDPARLVATGARVCYSGSDIMKIFDEMDKHTIEKMVHTAKINHHDSLMEHANFTFLIEGVSRVLSHQLVRHRIMSPHQRSQRYVTLKKGEYVIPHTVEGNKEAAKVFSDAMEACEKAYSKMIELGIPKEDARYIYPNAAHTQLIITINGRSLIHLLGLRLCNRAQWEIREMAEQMLWAVRDVCPEIFNDIGPNCVILGYCPEGEMSCGKIKEMKEKYLGGNV